MINSTCLFDANFLEDNNISITLTNCRFYIIHQEDFLSAAIEKLQVGGTYNNFNHTSISDHHLYLIYQINICITVKTNHFKRNGTNFYLSAKSKCLMFFINKMYTHGMYEKPRLSCLFPAATANLAAYYLHITLKNIKYK